MSIEDKFDTNIDTCFLVANVFVLDYTIMKAYVYAYDSLINPI